MQNKSELREWAKAERKKIDITSVSKDIVIKLQNTEEYKNSKNVMIYYPLKYEINLLELFKDTTKNFYLPKIEDENLVCCPYSIGEPVRRSCFNTCEPLTDACERSLIDLVIVPALAVDKKNYRLGYGGGFYDRFLSECRAYSIVCIPAKFVVNTVYPEAHDIPVTAVITV